MKKSVGPVALFVSSFSVLSLSESALAQALSSPAATTLAPVEIIAPQVRPRPPGRVRASQNPRRAATRPRPREVATPTPTPPVPAVPPQTATVGQPPVPYVGGQVGTGARLGLLGNTSVFTAPFNVTGYTSKLMEDQQARSIADVVLNDPSVRNDAPPFSERDSFFIRGFSVTNLDTAYDGLFYLANPRRAFLEGIERVEILKGPSALLSGGTGRVGGTINLIPKRATDEPLTRLTTSYISNSQIWNHLDLGRRFGDNKEWGVRFNGSYRNGDTPLDLNSAEVGVAALGLDYRSERFRASLDLNSSVQNITAPTSLFNSAAPNIVVPPAPNGRTNTASRDEFVDSRYKMIAGRAEYDLLPDTTMYLAGGGSVYNEDFLTSSYRITNSNGTATNSLAIQPQRLEGYTGEIGLRSKFRTGVVGHQLNISAVDANNELYRGGVLGFTPFSYVTNIYNPVRLPPGSFQTSGFAKSDDRPLLSRLTARSVAVSDTLALFDDRLLVTLGGRWQDIALNGFVTAPGPTLGTVSSRYQEARFSPAVGAVFRATDRLSVYGNYIESLESGPTAPALANNRNTIFPPVVSKQQEIGAKYDFGIVGLTASFFQIEQPNAFTDPATNIFSVSGLQRNRGAEFSVFGEPIKGLRLLGGITLIDAKLVSTIGGRYNGNDAPGVPVTALNLYGEYDLPHWLGPGVTVTGRVIHTGDVFYDQANTQTVSDWTRVDIGAGYAFTGPSGKPAVLRAAIENVADNAYYLSAARGYLAVGAPRTFVLSATFNF
ncbi:TonB-dependent siderophore receptor [Rhodopseudomonas palustris]|uniref:TonB-dependent receptor n=1 Tax=Rhodopseudomonas palustris TaxID=1076 RepID=UPI002ACD508B|nr:TonB-dependent siderophore receptor [Rhodopseudomonas palustris]WQG99842.1 TonB-dependent siderophore receptor [Rhodopseudomonas palustris]